MLADCLRKLVRQECRKTPRDGAVTLIDQHQEVEVPDLGDKAVVIRLDQCIGELSGIADGRWKKLCDYLIVRQDKNRIQVLFVELKSSMNNALDGYEQLRRSAPLFEYLRAMCRVENSNSWKKYEPRYVLITEKTSARIAKRPSERRIDSPILKTRHKEINVSCFHCPDGKSIPFDRLWQ